jgi:hypothetical protein
MFDINLVQLLFQNAFHLAETAEHAHRTNKAYTRAPTCSCRSCTDRGAVTRSSSNDGCVISTTRGTRQIFRRKHFIICMFI